jgi:hypothetical protein
MRITPKTIPTNGTTAITANPLKSDPIPPITARIAIIVTPNGLFFCIYNVSGNNLLNLHQNRIVSFYTRIIIDE